MSLSPYLAFAGNCAEAIAFYQQTLGAELMFKMTFGEMPPPAQEASDGCPSGQKMADDAIAHASLRRVNGVALCLIDHYFADLRFWPVLQTFSHGSLHDLLRDELDVKLTRARTKISARRAQAKESKLLEIPNMAPLLCVRTLNSRQGEQTPIEYSVSLTRADMIEFTMEH